MTNKEIEADLKKVRQKELVKARAQVGASGKDSRIEITDREWDAIQAGAISDNKLSQILNHTDVEKIKERATPRQTIAEILKATEAKSTISFLPSSPSFILSLNQGLKAR